MFFLRKNIFTLCILLFLLSIISIVYAKAGKAYGTFSSNGEFNSGWYWLRKDGHNGTWSFDTKQLTGAMPKSLYLNIHSLVTNGKNGGAGYGTKIKLQVIGGGISQVIPVELENVFKPQDSEYSQGIGYDSFGTAGPIDDKIWKNGGTITVVMAYPFTNKCHVAVNQGSIVIGFKR